MKFKSLFFTAIASVAALLASCTPQEQLIEPKMATDRATYTIGAEGGDVTVKLLAGQDWTATVVPGTSLDEVSDVTVTPDQGVASSDTVKVKVTFGENSGFNRKARVSFQGKTLSAAVVIEQEGKDGERLLKCSVSEFLQKPVDASVYYELTGIVGTIAHEEYSNFYIVDPVTKESIYIYGLAYKEDVTNQKVSLLVKEGVQEGDTITIASTRSDFNGTPQGKNSYYISHEKSQNPMIKLGISEIVAVAGGSFDLAVTSNKVTWTLTSDVEWLSFEPSTGSESTVVVVSVAEEKEGDVNKATITLSAEGLESVTCAVTRTNIQDATAAEVNAAEDGKVFRVTGIVSSIANETYGNLYIKDYTGEVYVYGTNNFAEEGIAAGDVITVVGAKTSYKEAPQMKNVDVEKHYSIKDTPVADFRAAEDSQEVYYRLTGKVTRSTEEGAKFDLETWGNFALEDESGNVYVYGVVPAWGAATQQFGTLGVKEGDTITIIAYKTTFKGTIEAAGCVYISHEAADTPRPDAKIYINEVSTGEKKLELYNASEQEVSLKGYSLKQRNDPNVEYKNWNFASLAEEVKIPAGGFVVVNCKQDTDATGPTFGLSGTKGFQLQLTFGEEVIDDVDNLTEITAIEDSQSYGRKTDGSEEWVVFGTPSLGESNAKGKLVVDATTCAELNAAILAGKNPVVVDFADYVEVTYVNGKNILAEDATGGVLLYDTGIEAVAGARFKGYAVVGVQVYSETLPEVTSIADITGITFEMEGATHPCATLTIADLLANYDRYLNCKVNIEGVSVTDGWQGSAKDRDGKISQGENEIAVRVQVSSDTLAVATGCEGDIVVWPSVFKTTKQLGFWPADYAAGETYFTVTKSTEPEPEPVVALKNCGEINAAILAGETALNIKLDNPAEITLMGSDKKSIFVQDETGAVLIYSGDLYTMLSGAGAAVGYAIQGEFTATASPYNGLPQITAAEVGASNLTATNKFPCVNLTIAELLANFDKYLNCKVKISDVTVTDGWSGSDKNGEIEQAGTTIPLYVKNYSNSITVSVPTGSKGNFTGFVAYNYTTQQLTFWEDSGFVATELPGSITVKNSVSLEVGATAELAATVNSGAALSYATADETVATVSAEGVVTAVKEGTTTITVTAPATGIYTAASAEVAVTVIAAGAAVPTWTKVETVADLLAGGKAIIGYNSKDGFIPMANFGTATSSATGFLYSGAAASANDKTVLDMANPGETSNFEVTIEASTVVEGAVCIKAKDGYIGNENTKNNCKLFAEHAEYTSFVPAVEGGVFTLKLSNATYHTLQYNASSPRFAVYSGTQSNVVIYILK